MLDDFVALSCALTGEPSLDSSRAHEYLERVVAVADAAALATLLSRFREIVRAGGDVQAALRDRILGDATIGPLAERILMLWYTSGWLAEDDKTWALGTADQYFSSLLWPAIRAHVPGLSGGYFGHWAYPPDN